MELKEVFDMGVNCAQIAFPVVGAVFPTWFGVTAEGKIVPIAARQMDDKDATLAKVKEAFKEEGVVQYVSVLESWMLKTAEEDVAKAAIKAIEEGRMAVSEHPDREEAVFVAAEDGHGGSISGFMKIIRPEKGNPVLGELEMLPTGTHSSGRFVDLLGSPALTRH